MRVTTFGGLAVEVDGVAVDLGPPKQRAVLALLSLEAGRTIPTDRIIDLLWDDDGRKERSALQAYVSNLRRALEPSRERGSPDSVVALRAPGYLLDVDEGDVDLHRFQQLVARGSDRARRGDAEGAAVDLDDALAIADGPLLPELDLPPVVAARDRVARTLGEALEGRAALHLDAGDAAATVRLLEPRLAEHPTRERLHALAARAMYVGGRQTDALATLDQLRHRLVEDAGLDVGPEVVALEQQILNHDPALSLPAGAAQRAEPAARTAPVAPGLVGRDAAIAALGGALATGGVATITGEPGIGKTALVEHLATSAGVPVATVHCPDGGGAPPFWPFVRLSEQLVAQGAIHDTLVDSGTDGTDPFAIAQRAAGLLVDAGRILLVVDDLQWADPDTLRALTHLVGALRTGPPLLVCTSRPLSSTADEALVACMDELTRSRVLDVALTALDATGTAELVSARAGTAVSGSVARYVHQRSGGNPLFVRELTDLLGSEGRLDDEALDEGRRSVPSGVSAVVRRRVAKLDGPDGQRLLTIASVLGSPFPSAVLADVAGLDQPTVVDGLGAILDAGLLVAADEPGTYRFSHALVEDALLAELNPARRASLHAAAAHSIARRHPTDDRAALVARHAVAGIEAGTAELAIDAGTRAAMLATARSAHTEAARHWDQVATAMEAARPTDVGARVEVRSLQAGALLRADRVMDARPVVTSALQVALGLGDAVLAGETAGLLNPLSIYTPLVYGERDDVVVSLLEATLDLLSADHPRLRSLVLGALVVWTYQDDDPERLDRLSAEALDLAWASDDDRAIALALHSRAFALRMPGRGAERVAAADALVALCDERDLDDDLRLLGHLHGLYAEHDLGDLDATERRLAVCAPLGARPVGDALRSQLGFCRAHVDLLRGRRDASVLHREEAFEIFRRSRPYQAGSHRMLQVLSHAQDFGGLDEILSGPLVEILAGYDFIRSLWLVSLLLEVGERDEALARVPLVRGVVPDRPRDYLTVSVDAAIAEVAVETGDIEVAAAVLARLEPQAGNWAGGFIAAPYGLVDLSLARLSATIGDREAAERWFRSAAIGHEHAGTPSWLARTLLHHGAFLAGGDGSDRERSAALLARAEALATDHGYPHLAARIASVQG